MLEKHEFRVIIVSIRKKPMDPLALLFERYSRHLSLEQISIGISSCIDNALNIFGDAMILHRHKRYPRALALLLTSIQEAGKVSLLRQMSLLSSKDQKEWSRLWKRFRDHKTKDARGQSTKINQDVKGDPGEAFWQQCVYNKTFAPAKEKIRQCALYVDFISKDCAWWSPSEITAELVEHAIDDVVAALYMLYHDREMGLFSVPALRIYSEEFAAFTPDIELGKEYDITDFGVRAFGINGPFKRAWKRLIDEGILKDIPENLFVMGKPWREWLLSPEYGESLNKS